MSLDAAWSSRHRSAGTCHRDLTVPTDAYARTRGKVSHVSSPSPTHGPIRIGAVLPQIELPPDPHAIRRYVEHLERHEYSHVLAYDHVLGASTASRPGWRGAYSSTDPFLEVLTALSWA